MIGSPAGIARLFDHQIPNGTNSIADHIGRHPLAHRLDHISDHQEPIVVSRDIFLHQNLRAVGESNIQRFFKIIHRGILCKDGDTLSIVAEVGLNHAGHMVVNLKFLHGGLFVLIDLPTGGGDPIFL